jgi:ribose transport system substrate-binding protein
MGNRTTLVIGAALATTALLATACGSGQIGDTGGSSTNNADNKNLVLIPGVSAEPFYISMRCGAEAEAKAKGYTVKTQAPQKFDPSDQTPIVTGVLANKPAAVLIAPTDDKAMAGPMKQLKDAGVKVVEVDTSLRDTSIASSSISSDNEQGGQKAADTLAKLVGDKRGSVLVLNTIAGTSTTDAREKGFAEEIKKYPNITYIGQQYTNNDAAESARKVTATLSSTPDLIGVFATNLNTGEGAATGLRTAGKTGQVDLVGFDASPKEVSDLKNGSFQALIAQDPATIGKDGVDQAVAALGQGGTVTRNIATDLVSITKDNMDQNSKYLYRSSC